MAHGPLRLALQVLVGPTGCLLARTLEGFPQQQWSWWDEYGKGWDPNMVAAYQACESAGFLHVSLGNIHPEVVLLSA